MGLDVYLTVNERAVDPDYPDEGEQWVYKAPEDYDREMDLRSSYNGGGYNTVSQQIIGKEGHYYPFEVFANEDGYPDGLLDDASKITVALERAREMVTLWEQAVSEPVYRCMDAAHFPNGPKPASPEEALAVYKEERERWKEGAETRREAFLQRQRDALAEGKTAEEYPWLGQTFEEHEATTGFTMSAYSSRNGLFYHEGLTVVGVVPGVPQFGFGGVTAATYLIYTVPGEDMAYYVDQARKAVAMLEYAQRKLEAGAPVVLQWSA